MQRTYKKNFYKIKNITEKCKKHDMCTTDTESIKYMFKIYLI